MINFFLVNLIILKIFRKKINKYIFISADKGKVTVRIEREKYIEKANNLFSDKNAYKIIDGNPNSILTDSVRSPLISFIRSSILERG